MFVEFKFLLKLFIKFPKLEKKYSIFFLVVIQYSTVARRKDSKVSHLLKASFTFLCTENENIVTKVFDGSRKIIVLGRLLEAWLALIVG